MRDELTAEGKALVAMLATADVRQSLMAFMEQAARTSESLERFVKALEALTQQAVPTPDEDFLSTESRATRHGMDGTTPHREPKP